MSHRPQEGDFVPAQDLLAHGDDIDSAPPVEGADEDDVDDEEEDEEDVEYFEVDEDDEDGEILAEIEEDNEGEFHGMLLYSRGELGRRRLSRGHEINECREIMS